MISLNQKHNLKSLDHKYSYQEALGSLSVLPLLMRKIHHFIADNTGPPMLQWQGFAGSKKTSADCLSTLFATYLKIISKRPRAQHLKEGVVVDILAHIIQVIVLASSSDAFLGISSSAQLCHWVWGINGVQEDGLKLKKEEALLAFEEHGQVGGKSHTQNSSASGLKQPRAPHTSKSSLSRSKLLPGLGSIKATTATAIPSADQNPTCWNLSLLQSVRQ